MRVEPYLNFDGRCEEAVEFYKKALGAKVAMLMRFGDAPPHPGMNPAHANKVMHMALTIGDSTIMGSDSHNEGNPVFKGISLSLTVQNDADAQRMFAALAEGGKIDAPLSKTFFSSQFGMVHDRFGILWMVLVAP